MGWGDGEHLQVDRASDSAPAWVPQRHPTPCAGVVLRMSLENWFTGAPPAEPHGRVPPRLTGKHRCVPGPAAGHASAPLLSKGTEVEGPLWEAWRPHRSAGSRNMRGRGRRESSRSRGEGGDRPLPTSAPPAPKRPCTTARPGPPPLLSPCVTERPRNSSVAGARGRASTHCLIEGFGLCSQHFGLGHQVV